MGFFDKLFGSKKPAKPEGVAAKAERGVVCAAMGRWQCLLLSARPLSQTHHRQWLAGTRVRKKHQKRRPGTISGAPG